MDPSKKHTRNRRSAKKGSSWMARSRRLRAYLNKQSDTNGLVDEVGPPLAHEPSVQCAAGLVDPTGPLLAYAHGFPHGADVRDEIGVPLVNAPGIPLANGLDDSIGIQHSPAAAADTITQEVPLNRRNSRPLITQASLKHVPAGPLSSAQEITAAISELKQRLLTMTKDTILGVMSLYGCASMTVRQYEFVCSVVSAVKSDFILPSASSVRRVKWPFFINKVFPKGFVVNLQTKENSASSVEGIDSVIHSREGVPSERNSRLERTNMREQQYRNQVETTAIPEQEADVLGAPTMQQGARADNFQHTGNQTRVRGNGSRSEPSQHSPLLIIPVSEWAKYDVSNILLRDDLLHSHRGQSGSSIHADIKERCIEDSPLCTSTGLLPDHQDQLFIVHEKKLIPARRYDLISFNSTHGPAFPPEYKFSNASGPSGSSDNSQGVVSFIFTAGASGDEATDNSTAYANFVSESTSSMGDDERLILPFLKRCSSKSYSDPNSHNSEELLLLKPGDICTVLLPLNHRQSYPINSFGVHISRFWRTATDKRSQLFSVFDCDLTNPLDPSIVRISEETVRGIPTLIQRLDSDHHDTPSATPPVAGTLSDGRRFYVYRILLYCDDFVPRSSLFPKGSVGGVYFIPLSLSLRRRRGGCAIRTISLTPTGVSTNEVLDAIIPDLVSSATDGIETIDADGCKVTIFIEVVGFIGDYPESSKVSDLMSHSAGAPCTHCSFRHRKLVEAAKYAYSLAIHSYNSAFGRSLRKTLALRSSTIGCDDLRFLGMKDGSVDDIMANGRWPLLKLACSLESAKHRIPHTSEGKAVVSETFDPYARNAVAPDHLIAGLGKFMVEAAFVSLRTDTERKHLDVLLCYSLRILGFGTHSTLYNYKKRKFNSISMSTIYSIVMVIGPHLRSMKCEKDFKPLYFLELLASLIALTFWWPIAAVDGVDSFNYVHGLEQSNYHSDMISLVEKLVSAIRDECDNSEITRSRLDKPNTHRLLELYRNTIPRFSHAMFCLDMGFERNHQPLKSALLHNTNDESHITAVCKSIGSDWFGRLSELIVHRDARDASNHSAVSSELSEMRTLRRIMLGELVTRLPSTDADCIDFLEKADEQINGVLDADLKKLIVRWHSNYVTSWESGNWTGVPHTRRERAVGKRAHKCSDYLVRVMTERLRTYIQQEGNEASGFPFNVTLYSKVWYVQKLGSLTRRRYNHHSFQQGDFIECFADVSTDVDGQPGTIIPSDTGTGKHFVCQVHFILGCRTEDPWAVVVIGKPYLDNGNAIVEGNRNGTSKCGSDAFATGTVDVGDGNAEDNHAGSSECASGVVATGTDTSTDENVLARKNVYTFSSLTVTAARIIKLTTTVRKTFGIHACDLDNHGCHVDVNRKTVSHRLPHNSQGTYTVISRKSGFPPRRS